MGYLYGASVQGIQGFIFETDKLKEMIGASEIVNQICELEYKNLYKGEDKNVYRAAAGNLRIAAENENEIKELVLKFPKLVQEFAPGITLSQAVVKYDGSLTKKHMDLLEDRLKVQRNKPFRPAILGLTAIERSRRTGKPASARENSELLDTGTLKKISMVDLANKRLVKDIGKPLCIENVNVPFDLEHFNSSWLAVIHADGNGLGKIIQSLGEKVKKDLQKAYSDFSKAIDTSTKVATSKAFRETIKKDDKSKYFPFRPIILGGDDLTVICRADQSLQFTSAYLRAFQEETKNNLAFLKNQYGIDGYEDGLTAAAGISFVKKSYPFHYAYNLAENLCSTAKDASDRKFNSVAFHKIMSSFTEDYKKIVERELTARASGVSFKFGPYAVEDNKSLPNIHDLISAAEAVYETKGIKSGLRRWLSELHESKDSADLLLKRINQVAKEKEKVDNQLKKLNISLENLIQHKDGKRSTPVYDLLSILSFEGEE